MTFRKGLLVMRNHLRDYEQEKPLMKLTEVVTEFRMARASSPDPRQQ